MYQISMMFIFISMADPCGFRTSMWFSIHVAISCFADGVPRWSLTVLYAVWSSQTSSEHTRRDLTADFLTRLSRQNLVASK